VQKVGLALASWRHEITGSKLLVCVSGGLDSVALLRLLMSATADPSLRLEVEVLHFNHGLRLESKAEASFVQDLARSYSLPFHLREADANRTSRWQHSGLQEDARNWRRSEAATLLGEIGSPYQAKFVVTAHHCDDQTETVLMKLLRGVHLSNIKGMESLARHPNEFGARTFRPLLESATKSELKAYLESAGQSWCEDPSNASPKYSRNKVRLELLPLLDLVCAGAFADRLAALSDQSSSLREWLEAEARVFEKRHPYVAGLPVQPWLELAKPLRSEVLHRFIANTTGRSSTPWNHLKRVEEQVESGQATWTLHLPGSLAVNRVGSVLRAGPLGSRPLSSPALPAPAGREVHRVGLVRGVTVSVCEAARSALAREGRSVTVEEWGGANASTSQGTRILVRTWHENLTVNLPTLPYQG